MNEQEYQAEINFIFNRFPSYQKVGKVAYKPGIETMEALDGLLGHPHRNFSTVHVAGTNGKGSTSHMIAAALMAMEKNGRRLRVGLYTSPHLVDFRERIKVNGVMADKEFIYAFLKKYKGAFLEKGASFFEITTALAFSYFEHEQVDVAVIECGLGGRLDSTNIITPRLSVITNIGLDHCEHLGYTLEEIAGEKAGIIKKGVPVIIGEKGCREVARVFVHKASEVGAPIYFAEELVEHQGSVAAMYADLMGADMDLKGDCQEKNLKTVCSAADYLMHISKQPDLKQLVLSNIAEAAKLTGLRGRWEQLSAEPLMICDTGHNAHGFAILGDQIRRTAAELRTRCASSRLWMIFGVVADKDLESIEAYLPGKADGAHYLFVNAQGSRALSAALLAERMQKSGFEGEAVPDGNGNTSIQHALARIHEKADKKDFVFIGGSNFVVAEVLMEMKRL